MSWFRAWYRSFPRRKPYHQRERPPNRPGRAETSSTSADARGCAAIRFLSRGAVGAFADDIDIGVPRQQLLHRPARQRLIVGDHCANHAGSHHGIRMLTITPGTRRSFSIVCDASGPYMRSRRSRVLPIPTPVRVANKWRRARFLRHTSASIAYTPVTCIRNRND